MQLSSPRDRLPRVASPPHSSRHPNHHQYHNQQQKQQRQQQQQGVQKNLQLLDLAFEGHVSSPRENEALESLVSDSGMARVVSTSAPRSARAAAATGRNRLHSNRGEQSEDFGMDPAEMMNASGFAAESSGYPVSSRVGYEQYEPVSTQDCVAVPDESVLMEASDPELFQAGVEEHAKRLGIDPVLESEFLWIARESLVAPLPEGWYHVTATETGAPYYYNENTGESRWDHPCDDQFRQIFTELKQKAFFQQSKRYDHYSPTMVMSHDNFESEQQEHLHTASYYAAVSYQTLAWQDEEQHDGDLAASKTTGGSGHYSDHANLSMYSSYPSQQDWSAAQDQSLAAEQSDAYYTDYPYKPVDGYAPQPSDYETEVVPDAYSQQSRSTRSRSSSPRSDLAETQHTERLTQQYLSQLQSMEELKAKGDQVICDLRIQIQTLSKQSELHEEKVQGLASEKEKLEGKLGDYKEKLDSFVKKCEDLTEMNQTMKRELLATRNRLEEQDEATKHADGEEVDKLTAQVGKERSLREEAERKYADVAKAQSRLGKELEDSQATIGRLREELSVRQAAEKQNAARASADAADATATAAIVATLQKQLGDREEELESAKNLSLKLRYEIDDLQEDQKKTAELLRAKASQQLAEKDRELDSERQELEKLRKGMQEAVEEKQSLEKEMEEQKVLSTAQLGEVEDQHRALKRENRAIERELKTLQTVSKEREEEFSATKRLVETLEMKLAGQEQLVESARSAGFAEAERASAEIIRQAQAEKARVAELYAHELQTRRKLHNRLMELQGNIRVFCRVRPIQPVELKSEQTAPAIFFRDNDQESLELVVGGSDGGGGNGDGGKGTYIGQKHSFEFDHIFQPSSTQAQVFEQTRALVVSALDGFNVCIFAYGQTGSGKTHTMEGSESDRGVNFRALQELFAIRDDRMAAGSFECTMKLSILEVYNETIVDLLESSGSSSGGQPGNTASKGLDVRMGKSGVYVDSLIEVEVFNENDVIDLMKLGHSHRSVGSHDFNEHSSRSHLVLSIQIETVQKAENRKRVSKLHLIDLAGSERVSKTAASGQRLKEAQNINRSLSALGDVIAALGASSKHVPYRNSKLTFLLQDSLSGNSKVLMFVNVSPVQWNAWETLCSLNFASRCRNVALGQAKQSSGNTSASASSAPSPTPGGASNGMHVSASMSSVTNNGASSRGGAAPMPPRGAPPSVPKSSQRVTYG